MANFFIGDEIKFAINLQAEGFSMDDDDFDVQIVHPRGHIDGTKDQGGSEDGKLIIYRDPAIDSQQAVSGVSDGPEPIDSSDSSDSSDEPVPGTWYCIVDTTGFAKGDLKVVATAHVPDLNANDGIRNEIATATYGKGENP